MTDPAPPASPEDLLEGELIRPIPYGDGYLPEGPYRISALPERFGSFRRLELLATDTKFVVIEPGRVFDDYEVEIPEDDVEALGLESVQDAQIFVTVTPSARPTVNLQAPFVINRGTGRAAQVILDDEAGFSLERPIDAGSARG
ncbi:MAG TPA: flagellar assembly protein FliW [Acidimicrobiales bacterium]|nr:flagellar assembly protein FliW [Acidimicrobiales bacterium]